MSAPHADARLRPLGDWIVSDNRVRTGFVETTIPAGPGQVMDYNASSIELPRGPVVEAFLEHRWAVFSVNPKQLDRFRDRHTVAGAKDDSRDAYVLADSLRTDQHCFRRAESDQPTIIRIWELSRSEESVGADLRRTVNQLYQMLLCVIIRNCCNSPPCRQTGGSPLFVHR